MPSHFPPAFAAYDTYEYHHALSLIVVYEASEGDDKLLRIIITEYIEHHKLDAGVLEKLSDELFYYINRRASFGGH